MELEPLWNIQETARYLRLHPVTTWRLASEGAIPAFTVGWQWRVKRELLDKWLDEKSLENLDAAACAALGDDLRGPVAEVFRVSA